MASSMFADALSSSETESDEAPPQRVEQRFMHYPSDDEDSKRVAKSARDKRFEEMQSIIKNMNNHKKIKDMSSVFNDFNNLVRVYEKSAKLNELDGVPAFYVRCIAELEDFVNDSWEKKKEMNKTAAKSLNILKQRVKKYNRDFEDNIKNFREHPENYIEEDATADADEDDEVIEEAAPPVKSTQKTGLTGDRKTTKRSSLSEQSADEDAADGDETDDSDDFWGSDGSSDSSSSSEGIDMERYKDDPSVYFLKKTTDEEKDKAKAKKAAKDRVTRKQQQQQQQQKSLNEAWTTVDRTHASEPTVLAFDRDQEITHEVVRNKMTEILATRGKKGTSTTEQILLLLQIEEKVVEHKLSVGLHAKLLISLVSVLFDYDKKSNNCMSGTSFDRLLSVFNRLFDILESHEIELLTPDDKMEIEESIENPPFQISGSILTMIQLLDTECTKVLQNANGHEMEYVDRLKDERRVCEVLDRLCSFLDNRKAPVEDRCVAYLMKLEHLYYKFDFAWARQAEQCSSAEDAPPSAEACPATETVEQLCRFIYSHDRTDRLRTRAILCHIYHLALCDQWFRARDLMLMSSLQMSIEHADQSTMILYNRALVQLGLAAFRQGHIREAHNALADLIGSGRIRELLAQGGVQTRYERSPEEEKREQALQTPYHMYINTELVECIYLLCAMLLEIPNLAAHETDLRWRPISKPFHLALRVHDRVTLVGPPETPRDHVMAAAKAMRYGNWKACLNNVFCPKMDAKIWNSFFHAERVRVLLEARIKEESLRSFLFTYSAIHNSMRLDRLADYFQLPKTTVYSIVSKMITNQELAASLEVPNDFLLMHKTERSRLQTLALQLSEKVNSVVEMNEKLIESRSGSASLGAAGGLSGYQPYQGRRSFAAAAPNRY